VGFYQDYFIDNDERVLIAGPCVIESRDMALRHAGLLCEAMSGIGLPWIFRASYDKANRTSLTGFRGIGLERGLGVLQEIREQFEIPVLTDVHTPQEASVVGAVVDMIQIPAFLGRQTDLLTAAGLSGCAINIKKPPFLAARQMAPLVEKITATGNHHITLTERGTSFGHGDLVVDFREMVIMQNLGFPVIFDATHSVQQPGALGSESGGQRQFVEPLAAAGLAVGVKGLFFEVHEDPPHAKSDRQTQVPLAEFGPMLARLLTPF